MPRSASDATRFTATGPYATAKPSARIASSIPLGNAPQGETPQQKIARLRAAAAQARAGQETRFDRVVRVGRVWADRAHRFTALSLIGLTGEIGNPEDVSKVGANLYTAVSGVFATYAIGDMLIHNRRKRNQWLADQQHKTAVDLAEARRLIDLGIELNEDQVLLINRERAAAESEAARKAKKGIFTRAKETVFGGLSEEEQKGGKIGAAARAAQDQIHELIPDQKEGLGIVEAVEDKIGSHRRGGELVENTSHLTGGVLDREAAADVDVVKDRTKSWTSWLTGR